MVAVDIYTGQVCKKVNALDYYRKMYYLAILLHICDVIKRNESFVGNIDFEIYPIIV